MKSEPFEDENSFLKFLKTGEQSGLIWMDHYGLQVVSNMYQITVHVLTTGVMSMQEPRARWTHIVPDKRLSEFSTVHKGLPDMWLLHVDETHFDLLIRKDSDLATEGSVDEMLTVKRDDGKEDEESDSFPLGPGYIGWKEDNEPKDGPRNMDLKDEIVEIKEAYVAMRKEFEDIKIELNKREKKQRLEINGLKEDYKNCMHDLKVETKAKNEAETLAKVLKDTLEARKSLDDKKDSEKMEVDDKSEEIDSDDSEWKLQRKQKKNIKKRARRKSCSDNEKDYFKCNLCPNVFESKGDLSTHKEVHIMLNCNKCDKMYWNEGDLKEHEQSHEDKIFQCEDCDKKFEKEDSFMNHKQIHKRSQTLVCDKCEDKFTLKRELMEHIVITHTELNDTQCREPGKGVAEI